MSPRRCWRRRSSTRGRSSAVDLVSLLDIGLHRDVGRRRSPLVGGACGEVRRAPGRSPRTVRPMPTARVSGVPRVRGSARSSSRSRAGAGAQRQRDRTEHSQAASARTAASASGCRHSGGATRTGNRAPAGSTRHRGWSPARGARSARRQARVGDVLTACRCRSSPGRTRRGDSDSGCLAARAKSSAPMRRRSMSGVRRAHRGARAATARRRRRHRPRRRAPTAVAPAACSGCRACARGSKRLMPRTPPNSTRPSLRYATRRRR